jgi:hypothetical protein
VHQFDRDGSILEYRRERERRELHATIVFAVVSVISSVGILAAVDIILSLYGK